MVLWGGSPHPWFGLSPTLWSYFPPNVCESPLFFLNVLVAEGFNLSNYLRLSILFDAPTNEDPSDPSKRGLRLERED